MAKDAVPITAPFTVLVDTREKAPFTFAGLHADADAGNRPLVVPTRNVHLATGDYMIDGIPDVAIERKGGPAGVADLYGTLGGNRARFERELVRLAALRWAAVIVEADWPTILHAPPPRSQLNPKTVYRSVLAWQQRYVNVHWWFCSNREFAEVTTYRLLERAWKEAQKAAATLAVG